MTYRVTLIPGDGIGPEITAATLQVLDATGVKFAWDQQAPAGVAVERRGETGTDPVIESIRTTGVAMDAAERVKGAVIRAIRDDEVRTKDLGGNATTSEFAQHVSKLVRG
jgi:isocitrate/isopropylmalate dehydrogenase